MALVSIRQLSRRTGAVIEDVQTSRRPAILTSDGRPVAALVALSPDVIAALEDYVLLNSAESIASMARAERTLASGGGVPILQVRAKDGRELSSRAPQEETERSGSEASGAVAASAQEISEMELSQLESLVTLANVIETPRVRGQTMGELTPLLAAIGQAVVGQLAAHSSDLLALIPSAIATRSMPATRVRRKKGSASHTGQ